MTMVRVDVFVLQTDCGRLVLSWVKDIGQAMHKVQTFHQVLPVSRDFFRTGWSPYVSLLFAAAAACAQSELLIRHHQLHHSTAHVFEVNL